MPRIAVMTSFNYNFYSNKYVLNYYFSTDFITNYLLFRYAEEKQDLALLSISTFQRALKDPNQLIRASALRVLSSIRELIFKY